MGRAKEWMLEQEERGWYEGPDSSVCPDCFDDDVLSSFVREHADAFECDYCGNTSQDNGEDPGPIAAPFNAVMEVIAEGLFKEWNYADDEGIPYESAEGGYLAETVDRWDLVYDWVPVSNEKLQRDIAKRLPDQQFCERDFGSLGPAQSMAVDWESFCHVVKHRNRFVFIRPQSRMTASPPEQTNEAEPGVLDSFGPSELELAPEEILDTIGHIVESASLVRRVPAGTIFKRARVHSRKRMYRSAETLGTPPENKVRYPNRMSPSGIAMFYGALDGYTAVAETKTRRLTPEEIVTVAEFVSTKDFSAIDFSNLPRVPSLFSNSSRRERGAISFLHDFVQELSKPIRRNSREHTEYVPTQVVTEYFRYAFRPSSGEPVRGIYYPSSRVPNGVACVLFFDREACGVAPESAWTRPEQFLKLDVKSIARMRRRPAREKPPPPASQGSLFS